MSRHRIILAGIIIPLLLSGQDIDEAIRLFNSFQFSRAKEIFYELKKNGDHPRIGEVYYYLGRLSVNPDSAAQYYYGVINDYPQSRYADISYLEIAKINIARKNFATAISNLDELLRRYPETEYRDEIMFWQGVSHISVGNTGRGESLLASLQSDFPRSVWSERAANITQKKEITQEYYTVQLGSYRNKNNAENYAVSLREKGVDARIVEAVVKGHKYYRVWSGQFAILDKAKEHLAKLDSLGLKGNVVRGP
ncbi:MAG: SPOR domain-containing protein [candidate division WOR-3 bacterium]|nr:MAG: SPOR domain-containing protein [candidate division WOR-3 bacterium]